MKHTHHVAREAGKRTGRGCTAGSSADAPPSKFFEQNDEVRLMSCFTLYYLQKKGLYCAIGWGGKLKIISAKQQIEQTNSRRDTKLSRIRYVYFYDCKIQSVTRVSGVNN